MANATFLQYHEGDEKPDATTAERLADSWNALPKSVRDQIHSMNDLPADYGDKVNALHGSGDDGEGIMRATADEDGNITVENAGAAGSNRVVAGATPEQMALQHHARDINRMVDELEALPDPSTPKGTQLRAQIERAREAFFAGQRQQRKQRELDMQVYEADQRAALENAQGALEERGGTIERTSRGTRLQFSS
ncbi:hypothetical protein [Lentisalinibacter salinarum]|uniref:hypothetical protein n=1 Tax=Lentisalinibacter salinarum TaxID=2992239 RepID=UPI0038668616